MSITEKMRNAFDACTIMAGVEPDFECVYMTKGVALLYLDEIDAEFDKMDKWHSAELQAAMAENAKLRELILDIWNDAIQFDGFWDYVNDDGEVYREDELPHYQERMRELGIEVEQ